MSDVVVTVPKRLWTDWLAEGELPGQDRWPCVFCNGPFCNVCEGTGELTPGDTRWDFSSGGGMPRIEPGERVYVVAHGRLRGYAPLVEVAQLSRGIALRRSGRAEAVTIADPIRGFQGWRYRWWDRADELPFPDFATAGVAA